jgi:hypothetical protein
MLRRGFLGLMLAAFLLMAVNGAASAQRGGGFGQRGGFGGGLALLRTPEVQKELKMTPEQISKVDAKQQEVGEAMQQLFQSAGNPQDMTAEERAKFQARVQEVQAKAVNDILTDEAQRKRFRQLELQQQGGNALTRKEVADELKLTDDQKKKIGDLQQEANQARRDAMQGIRDMSPEERQKAMAKLQDMQKATTEKQVGVLTDAQKAQWKEMQGAAFTFPPVQFGGGRRQNP